MTAKRMLFTGSAVVIVVGVGVMAVLGSIAKVPAGEYWTVVLGSGAVGVGWMALLSALHLKSEKEHH